jgi:alcohol dehydrogenase class IV
MKVSLRSAHMLPRIALVDPGLAADLPPEITAATGMDALTQLIEPFVSPRANPVTDALCSDAIPRVARALPALARDPHDAGARADMALGALFSGLALANAGLGAVHGFAGPIGGMFPAPHGAVCARLLAPVTRANLAALRARAPAHPSLARYDEVARLLTGDPAAGADESVVWLENLARDLRIPALAAWGIAAADFDAIAGKAAAASSMKANPIVLSQTELCAVLDSAATR